VSGEKEIDPEDVSLDEPVSHDAKIIPKFFAGEDTADFIERESLLDLSEYAYSMKKTLEDVKDKYEKAVAEIKKRLKVETLSKKHIENLGKHQIIVTKRAGSVSFDAEAYIRETFSDAAWKDLEETKEQVKKGEVESKYFTRGKESVAVEIV
jgi:hypothetical protein